MKYSNHKVYIVIRPLVVLLLLIIFFSNSDYAQSRISADKNIEVEISHNDYSRLNEAIASVDTLKALNAEAMIQESSPLPKKPSRTKKLNAHSLGINQLKRAAILAGALGTFFIVGLGFHRKRKKKHQIYELNTKIEELRLANEQLTNAYQELRQFTRTSLQDLHDSVHTLSDFSTFIEIRYKDELDPESKEHLQFIKSGIQKIDESLAVLIKHASSGILEQKPERLDLEEIIDKIAKHKKAQHPTLGIEITTYNLQALTADARQIRILFDRLIDNAIKFRSDKNPVIEVGCVRLNEKYLFSIQDNGIGMDEAERQQLLDADSSSVKFDGKENSLSICRKIVQQHNGSFWIESQKAKGTTVFFELPHSTNKKGLHTS